MHVDRIPASVARLNKMYEAQKRREEEKKEKIYKIALYVSGAILGCMLLGVIF
jgi:hypothetical protein